jgi:hypothetical protein
MPVVQVSPEVRQLDLDAFRLTLRQLESTDLGVPFPDTHRHNTEYTISGFTYARAVEIINGYTVEFEDGFYGVAATGANANVLDVKVANSVSFNSQNSGGLIVTADSGLTPGESATLSNIETIVQAIQSVIDFVVKLLRNRRETNPSTGVQTIYDDDSITPLVSGDLFEDVAGTQPYQGQGADRADRME